MYFNPPTLSVGTGLSVARKRGGFMQFEPSSFMTSPIWQEQERTASTLVHRRGDRVTGDVRLHEVLPGAV